MMKFCGIDKTNVGFVATSSFPKDANLAPDDIPNSLSLVCTCLCGRGYTPRQHLLLPFPRA